MEFQSATEEVSNRLGTVDRELSSWLVAHAEDEGLLMVGNFLYEQLAEWRAGKDSISIIDAIIQKYKQTDGLVSEITSAVLYQSTMWFSYEANIPLERELLIDEQLLGGAE